MDLLTDEQRSYLAGQHELCQDVDKVKVYDEKTEKWHPLTSKGRERFLTRKRVMEYRIRERTKKAKKMIKQFLFDYELLKSWNFYSGIENELEELHVRTKEIDRFARALNSLRKTGRIKGRKRVRERAGLPRKGYPIKVKFDCSWCGKENNLSIIDFKDETWICTTTGMPRTSTEP